MEVKREAKDMKEEVKDEPSDEPANGDSEDSYLNKLISQGLPEDVSSKLVDIIDSGNLKFSALDDRAISALKELPEDAAVGVVQQFADSDLPHVTNKSAYLCGIIKSYRQKRNSYGPPPETVKKGPDENKIKDMLDRTGYSLEVTTGQRRYGGPPPDYDGPEPGDGHEVFIGHISRGVYEDELVPLLEKCGTIWDMRLMMDPQMGVTKGFAFVTFIEKQAAKNAVTELSDYELRPGKGLKINVSVPNRRLYVGNIPKYKSKDDIMTEFKNATDGLKDVIVYECTDDLRKKNRGFAFLEYSTHKNASAVKRGIEKGKVRAFNADLYCEWADPLDEPDEEVMAKVKVLYIRKLKADVTEEELTDLFKEYGAVEKVKKVKDYAFVHFEERDDCEKALDACKEIKIKDVKIEAELAKPPSEQRNKRRRERMPYEGGRGGGSYQGGFRNDSGWGGGYSSQGGRGRPYGGGGGGRQNQWDYNYDPYGGFGAYAEDYSAYGGGGSGFWGYDHEGYGSGGYGGWNSGYGGRGSPMQSPGRGGYGGGRGGGNRGSPRGGGARSGPSGGGGYRGSTPGGSRGRGGRDSGGSSGGGFKRKIGGQGQQSPGQAKKRNVDSNGSGAQSWSVNPICQQPMGNNSFADDSLGDSWN